MPEESAGKGLVTTFQFLASSSSTAALDLLEIALREESEEIQRAAVTLLTARPRRNYAALLARNYIYLSDQVKPLAVRDKTALFSILGEVMNTGNEVQRYSVLELIRDLEDTRGAKVVVLAIADASPRVAEKARASLLRMVWRTVKTQTSLQDRFQLLTALLEGFSRLSAFFDPLLLGTILKIDSSDTSPVLKLAASPAEEQRRRLLRFLISTNIPEIYPVLIWMIQSDSGRARNAALWVLRSRTDVAFINEFANRLSTIGEPAVSAFSDMCSGIPWVSPYNHIYQQLDPKVQVWLSAVRSAGTKATLPVQELTPSQGPLSKVNINERKRMLRSIRDIRKPDEMEILRDGLTDPNEEVQRLAVEKLSDTKHPLRNKLLLAQVRSQFPEIRRAALAGLGRSVFASYFRSVDRLTPELRHQAGQALAKLDTNLLNELFSEFVAPDPQRRLRALLVTMATAKEKELARSILNCARDADERVRATAAGMLGRVGTPDAVRAIISALADPDNRVKANAVSALGILGDHQLAKIVRPFLSSSNARIRANAGVAMCQLGQNEGLRILQEMAADPDVAFRISAARGLGQLDPQEASAILQKLAQEDQSEAVRTMATRMLRETLTPEEVLEDAAGTR